jgi:hypothetical protein
MNCHVYMRSFLLPVIILLFLPSSALSMHPGRNDSTLRSKPTYYHYFSPASSSMLAKGDWAYSTQYFLFHEAEYGISDRFSMGFGTSFVLIPIVLKFRYNYPLNSNHNLSASLNIGDASFPDDKPVLSKMAFLLKYSYSKERINFNAGLGYVRFNQVDAFGNDTLDNPLLTLSCQYRVTARSSLLYELYFLAVQESHTVYEYIGWGNYQGYRYTGLGCYIAGFSGYQLHDRRCRFACNLGWLFQMGAKLKDYHENPDLTSNFYFRFQLPLESVPAIGFSYYLTPKVHTSTY